MRQLLARGIYTFRRLTATFLRYMCLLFGIFYIIRTFLLNIRGLMQTNKTARLWALAISVVVGLLLLGTLVLSPRAPKEDVDSPASPSIPERQEFIENVPPKAGNTPAAPGVDKATAAAETMVPALIIALIGVIVIYYRLRQTLTEVSDDAIAAQSQSKISDAAFAAALEEEGYKIQNVPMDNKCLFHAIAAQITQEDWQQAPKALQGNTAVQNWIEAELESDKGKAQADFLRALAMAFETQLIAYIAHKIAKQDNSLDEAAASPENTTAYGGLPMLSPQDIAHALGLEQSMDNILQDRKVADFIYVLYQDIHDELKDKADKIPVLNKNTSIADKWAYCQAKFTAYKAKTARPNNFAGTPEALAIAYCIKRPLAIFGNDPVAGISLVRDRKTKKILPMYEKKEGQGVPIRIYQNGTAGGHYQILHPPCPLSKTKS